MRKLFAEFSEKSTIHGLRYIGERNRHWTERLWWIIAVMISFTVCCMSIRNVWIKWRDSPVTVRFTEKEEPISSIPFPSVTICPQTKFYKEKLNLTTDSYAAYQETPEILTNIELMRLEALFHICENAHDFLDPLTQYQFLNGSIYETIDDIAPSLADTLVECHWRGKDIPCDELFVSVFTEDGLCFQFNALNSHQMYTTNMASEMMTVTTNRNVTHWSLENGYGKGIKPYQYPYRVFNAKQGAALSISMKVSAEDFNALCVGLIDGFKVFLTMPGDSRKSFERYFRILSSEQSEILIKPRMIKTSKVLRRYLPSQRKCFFDSERRLHFFKMYTQNNCEIECLANFTRIECGCLKFHMPREEHTKICGVANINCYKNAEKRLFGEDLIDDFKNDSVKMFRAKCNCLPSCTSFKYEADIDRIKFDWLRVLQSLSIRSKNLTDMQVSLLSLFFSDHQVVTLERIESYTITDIMAIGGGLLGLFLGVSLLSIIEFIYFATLRLFWAMRNDNVVIPFKRKTTRGISMVSADSQKQE